MAEDDFPALGAQAQQSKKKQKKNQKVSLDAFLADSSVGGSWADEMDSLPTAPMAREQGGGSGWGARGGRDTDRGFGERPGAYGRDSFADRAPRAEVPLPTAPPYIAYVGNLSFEATEADITDLFVSLAENITSIRLVSGHDGRSKGLAYVEFKSLDDLKNALLLSGTSMGGRSIRVSVAEPRRSDAKFDGEWRRDGPLPPMDASRDGRRGFDRVPSSDTDWSSARGGRFAPSEEPQAFVRRNFSANSSRSASYAALGNSSDAFNDDSLERGGFGAKFTPSSSVPSGENSRRSSTFGANTPPALSSEADTASTWRRAAPTPSSPSSNTGSLRDASTDRSPAGSHPSSPAVTRRKLELAPRTRAAGSTQESVLSPTASNKANPFGDARPVDTAEKERQFEEKRLQKEAEEKAAQANQPAKVILSRGDPFGSAKPVDTNARMQAIEAKIEADRSNAQAKNASYNIPASQTHSRQPSQSREAPPSPVKTSAYVTKALRKEGFSFANAAGGGSASSSAAGANNDAAQANDKSTSAATSESVDQATAKIDQLDVKETQSTTDEASTDANRA